MKFVEADDIRGWFARTAHLSDVLRSIGERQLEGSYIERVVGMPVHLRFLVERLSRERVAQGKSPEVPASALDAIPFHALCTGFFLPLSGMAPERAAQLFGMRIGPPPDTAGREALLGQLLGKKLGLSTEQKIACILGDPFMGRSGTFQRDSLVRLLMSVQLIGWREVLDRLSAVGDVAVLFAMARPSLTLEPALTAAEVLEVLRFLPDARRNAKFEILRALLARCGKVEAYFLAKLLLRKAGFGFDYQGPLIARMLAGTYGASEEAVSHAMALTDAFHVARVLSQEGPAGLRKIQLQPLVAVRPALASGTTDEIKKLPVWVERKYDGIRLMLHKSTDARGAMLCGAYTRNRGDWLELVAGLDLTIKSLGARNAIVDGELHGTVIDLEGPRPATVYEVYAALQGERATPVSLKYAAFDLIYLNGQDLTGLPLSERRRWLSMLVAPLAGMPLPVPVGLADGQLAATREDVSRLYHHFRAQRYEGIVVKDLEGRYRLSERDPTWLKRKPEITLDLVLTGAVLAVTTKERVGAFGSYVIAARGDAGFEDVGDVAGVDRERDAEIQAEILREGLLTGRRIERKSASGARAGYELRPYVVVTVKFEGIARDSDGRLTLRDPKIAMIRADKPAEEADHVRALEEIYLEQRVG
ncbi:ATP-dependent DNA ligase [Chondromyces apiculatus]|uniref:ATP dependent DNA ligase n=1 Tax=Chondromyces apiculatus DSM 436 TaxID=1192034 RepID=A0A017SXX6_9BACT|nr:RNA ligase family protein [Chondromyces apiculatus]EYF01823.1 ATP dependent DNA ligase [Chondromyces apiculatus DSM 436]